MSDETKNPSTDDSIKAEKANGPQLNEEELDEVSGGLFMRYTMTNVTLHSTSTSVDSGTDTSK